MEEGVGDRTDDAISVRERALLQLNNIFPASSGVRAFHISLKNLTIFLVL